MSETMRAIEETHPLEMDYESDARYIWPKRWDKASARVLAAYREFISH